MNANHLMICGIVDDENDMLYDTPSLSPYPSEAGVEHGYRDVADRQTQEVVVGGVAHPAVPEDYPEFF